MFAPSTPTTFAPMFEKVSYSGLCCTPPVFLPGRHHPSPAFRVRFANCFMDLRQCLIYDSCKPNARLIGVEYMIPREKYETLDRDEQKLWHSHNFEVQSGMLVLPYPASHQRSKDEWDALETEAMGEVVNLYGKLFHFWQVDKGHDLPLGMPKLMGSLTDERQLDVDEAMAARNGEMGIDMPHKRYLREGIPLPDVPANADGWWKEAEENSRGLYGP